MLKRTLIVGAGEAGRMVAREILDTARLSKQYELIGFLDDDEKKKSYFGFPVLGRLLSAESAITDHKIHTLIIAIPSASRDVITNLLTRLSFTGIEIKIVPGIYEIIEGDVSWKQIREVKPEDLLGREEVGFDLDEISEFYGDKTVFVTGAGGSIGSEISRQLLRLPVKRVIVFDREENNIHYLLTSLDRDPRASYVIGDIRDKKKLSLILRDLRPDILFHAAAHKHVPMMEEFPEEALKNNVIGTYHVARAAFEVDIEDFVFVSTDKAVNPTSVMGASKRIAERIVLAHNYLKRTRYILTRFGNVLGSRGSAIPTFIKQIKRGGPVTITHKEIERYFMSIPEAARLVIKAPTLKDGRIFVLNMGEPIRILELAKNLIKLTGNTEDEIPIIFTGLRKGEKLKEELFTDQEKLKETKFKKLMVLEDDKSGFQVGSVPSMVKEIEKVASTMDKDKIRKLIKKYVPEFNGKV